MAAKPSKTTTKKDAHETPAPSAVRSWKSLDQLIGRTSHRGTLDRLSLAPPPAFGIVGPQSSGKISLAVAFAARALARRESLEETSVERSDASPLLSFEQSHLTRIANISHTDVRLFAPKDTGSGNLSVDIVREEIQPFCRAAPFREPMAFVIIEDADIAFPEQHPQAANALLKMLEEPRANVHFVLTTTNIKRLLPTIRSRLRVLRVPELDRNTLSAIATLHHPALPPVERESAVAFSRGNLGRLMASCENPLAFKSRVTSSVNLLIALSQKDFLRSLAKLEDQTLDAELLELTLEVATEVIRYQITGASRLPEGIIASFSGSMDHLHIAHLASLGPRITETLELLRANAQPELSLYRLLAEGLGPMRRRRLRPISG